MDGIKKLLQAGVDASTINSVDIGATPETIFDQVEAFSDAMRGVQGIPMNIYMSKYWYKKYLQDKRARPSTRGPRTPRSTPAWFTPLSVKGLACMVNTTLSDTEGEPSTHTTETLTRPVPAEEAKRCVAVMADWWEGLGFGLNQVIWTNLQPTVTP